MIFRVQGETLSGFSPLPSYIQTTKQSQSAPT